MSLDDDKNIEYYKAAYTYWKLYAEKLEEETNKKNKKKIQIAVIMIMAKMGYSVKQLCEITGISRSTYYYNKDNNCKAMKDKQIISLIQQMPEKEKSTYGVFRKVAYLAQHHDVLVNHKRMQRICAEYGLNTAIRIRKQPKNYYKQKKEEKKNLPKNILDRNFTAIKAFEKLVTDISYFKVKKGWLYLSAVRDLFNSEIIEYKCSHNCDGQLAVQTLLQLGDLENTIVHTDQGATYTAKEFRECLKNKKAIHSMSRRGNCWDNACIENFFGTLKCEIGYHQTLKEGLLTYEQMEKRIADYIQFFNNDRIQKKLNWMSPVAFRQAG